MTNIQDFGYAELRGYPPYEPGMPRPLDPVRVPEKAPPALGDLFDQTVEAAAKVGLVKLNHVSVDGTKVKANDRAEDELYGKESGWELPPELADTQKRREFIRERARQAQEQGPETHIIVTADLTNQAADSPLYRARRAACAAPATWASVSPASLTDPA